MLDKNQKTRWSQKEFEFIRSTFGGEGENILYYVRDMFLQLPIQEKMKLEPDVIAVLRKQLMPRLSNDAPLKAQSDLDCSLSIIKDMPMDAAILRIKAFSLAEKYLAQQFNVLEGKPNEGKITLSDFLSLKENDSETFISMFAWQILANSYIEDCLDGLRLMAKPVITPEQEAERLAKNSSK